MKGPLLALMISSIATAAFACECGGVSVVDGQRTMSSDPPPLSTSELKGYTAVFSGRVVRLDVDRVRSKQCEECFTQDVVATFEVSSQWKGHSGHEYVVRTPGSSSACGYPFELGQEYLVYVKKGTHDFRYDVDLCSRTGELVLASAEVRFLEQLKASRRSD